jgi:hypothetical protein
VLRGCGYARLRDDERLLVETTEEAFMAFAIGVGLDVALIPRHAERRPGFWMTKKSKSVLGGRPATETSITSTGPPGLMLTRAVAFGKHFDATNFAPRTMSKVSFFSLAYADPVTILVRRIAASAVVLIVLRDFIYDSCWRKRAVRFGA